MVGIDKIMALTVLAVLVLTGCGDRADWVGEWKGSRNIPLVPGEDPNVATTMRLIKLKITKEGHFELSEEGFGKAGPALLGADTATLTIDTMLGRRIQSLGADAARMGGERKLKFQKDGTILFLRDNFEPVTLNRASH